MSKIIAIIPAGGKGSRFNSDIPKQYHVLCDVPIIIRTLKQFMKCSKNDKIVLNIDPSFKDYFVHIAKEYNLDMDKIELLTCPGKERQNTVYNILKESKSIENADLILVHDAVRCLVTTSLIEKIIDKAKINGNACPGNIPKNTIKEVYNGDAVIITYNRNDLREIQTPQAFPKDQLLEAYKHADEINFVGTDSASLVEAMGKNVYVIEGEETNIKITTPLDFKLAKLIIEEK